MIETSYLIFSSPFFPHRHLHFIQSRVADCRQTSNYACWFYSICFSVCLCSSANRNREREREETSGDLTEANCKKKKKKNPSTVLLNKLARICQVKDANNLSEILKTQTNASTCRLFFFFLPSGDVNCCRMHQCLDINNLWPWSWAQTDTPIYTQVLWRFRPNPVPAVSEQPEVHHTCMAVTRRSVRSRVAPRTQTPSSPPHMEETRSLPR